MMMMMMSKYHLTASTTHRSHFPAIFRYNWQFPIDQYVGHWYHAVVTAVRWRVWCAYLPGPGTVSGESLWSHTPALHDTNCACAPLRRQAIMPGFHHSVAVLPLPFRRSSISAVFCWHLALCRVIYCSYSAIQLYQLQVCQLNFCSSVLFCSAVAKIPFSVVL